MPEPQISPFIGREWGWSIAVFRTVLGISALARRGDDDPP